MESDGANEGSVCVEGATSPSGTPSLSVRIFWGSLLGVSIVGNEPLGRSDSRLSSIGTCDGGSWGNGGDGAGWIGGGGVFGLKCSLNEHKQETRNNFSSCSTTSSPDEETHFNFLFTSKFYFEIYIKK